jgi:hypothetical protein
MDGSGLLMGRASVVAATEDVAATEPEGNGSHVTVMLTRDVILAAPDLQTEVVDVPEWGGAVIVRGMNGAERDSFERSMVDIKGSDTKVNWTNFRAKLLCRTVVDSEGKRIFKDDDATMLGTKSALALQRVFRVAQRLSGLADDEVEELTNSLKETPSEDSGSA